MQKVGGEYADPTMRIVLIPTDTPTAETLESLEEKAEGLITGDVYQVIEDGELMKPAAGGSCFELHVGAGADSTFTIDTSGISGLAIYAQHVPTEFERDRHYLYDSKGTDIEPIAQEGGEGGHHHHHHGDLVVYSPSDVLLLVESKAAKRIPSDPAFGFLGQPGDLFYELPQHEEEGLLFLGIATDELEKGIFAGDQVQMNLTSVDGPGHVYLYATDTFGSPVVMFNSADGISEADKFVTKAGAHAHQSMAFSEAGTYRVGFDFSGKLAANGEETRSEKFELLFEVEEADHDDDSHGHDDLAIGAYSTGASPFSLSFETKAGLTYEIEASHDLNKWEEIGEVKGNGGSVDFIDQREALFSKQYYRIKIK
jgi:surface-anchored protein